MMVQPTLRLLINIMVFYSYYSLSLVIGGSLVVSKSLLLLSKDRWLPYTCMYNIICNFMKLK